MPLFGDRKLKQLESAIKNNPSPDTYCALIKHLQKKNNLERVTVMAVQAREMFPDSNEVFNLCYPILKKIYAEELKKLRAIVASRPTSAAYSQLAEIHLFLREEEEALKLCRAAIERFPNDDNPYLIVAEIRLKRFYKDLLSRDGQLAKENLEKSFQINSKNYKALLHLAKFYLQIGAVSKAKQRLRNILLFAPEDENIRGLMRILKDISAPPHEDHMDLLLQTAEQEKRLFYTLEGTRKEQKQAVVNPGIFDGPLKGIKNSLSILCLFVCDEEGNLIAHHAQENVDFNTYYDVAASIYQTVQESSKQMDLGRFQHGQIEGPFGAVHIVTSEPIVYIAFGQQKSRPKQVYRDLQRFISEVSHLQEKGALNA